jgi:hypothetical protein
MHCPPEQTMQHVPSLVQPPPQSEFDMHIDPEDEGGVYWQ